VILKSYIVEQNLEILNNYQATLIHGENNGIKDDVKVAIKDQNKNSEVITFFENEILKNNFLYENMTNLSLFNQKKIIFIYEATDKIFNQLSECLEKENINIKIYIFSNILERNSKLKNFFEKNKKLAIFPCYKDNERTLIAYISKELKEFKGLNGEIINLIINNSNLDRKIIKNELAKIKVFFLKKKINKEQIFEILNIKTDSGFDEIRDKALAGDKFRINKLLSDTEVLHEEAFFYLNSINHRITRLLELIKICEGNKNSYEKALETFKPPIFWKDKPIILQQMFKWSKKKLEEMMVKITETEVLMKKNSYLRNDIIIKDLIISLANKATTS